MSTIHQVTLSEDLESFITAEIESGHYESAGEIFDTALRSLQHYEQNSTARIHVLRNAIDEGDASGVAEDGVFERVRQTLGLSQ